MPRPNQPRGVLAETHLADRIASEREARGWTNEGLAKRMTDAGCPMNGSAIFKIEKGQPRRRIVVDELVAFARVFGVEVAELLVPPELAGRREVVRLLVEWDAKDSAARAATAEANEAWGELRAWIGEHPDMEPVMRDALQAWSESHFEGDHDFRTARMLSQLSDSESAREALRDQLRAEGLL